MPILKKITRELPCELTELELASKANQLVENIHQINVENGAFDLAKGAHKKKISELEDASQKLAIEVRTRREDREVECEEHLDRAGAVVNTVRTDTGKRIWSRQASPSELSSNSILFAAPAKEAAGK